MDILEFIEKMKRAPSEPMDPKRVSEILKNSYKGFDSARNVDGALNLIIVMEELAELQQEISKFIRGEGNRINMIEELADNILNIYYIQNICGISDETLMKAVNVKLERQNKRNPIKA